MKWQPYALNTNLSPSEAKFLRDLMPSGKLPIMLKILKKKLEKLARNEF